MTDQDRIRVIGRSENTSRNFRTRPGVGASGSEPTKKGGQSLTLEELMNLKTLRSPYVKHKGDNNALRDHCED